MGDRWTLQLRPTFFALLGSVVVLGAVGMVGMAVYSESPRFCRSCHIMEPYYAAWATSKHNHVACIECHYPPAAPRTLLWKKFQAMSQVVKYVTLTYSSKPFAEVEDISCTRSGCHSQRLLQGKLMTKQGVKFDHRPHLTEVRRGRQLRCVSCHGQVMIGSHIEVTYDSCFLCHFKGRGEGKALSPIGGCLGCHNLPTKTFQLGNMKYNHKEFVSKPGVSCLDCHLESISGSGDAPKDRCLICHNQPEKLARYGDIPFIHENHVTKHYIACFHCHQEIWHGVHRSAGEKVPRPTDSPSPRPTIQPLARSSVRSSPRVAEAPALECSNCHQHKHLGQREMYTGQVGSLGLPDLPSPMHEAHVECIGCHFKEQADRGDREHRGETFRASTDACTKCHGPKFKGIWEETKAELAKALSETAAKLATVKTALGQAVLPEAAKRELTERVGLAERRHHFVQNSTGEHNIYLASQVLRLVDRSLTEAGKELKASTPNLMKLSLISGKYCATMCHVRVGVLVPPETVKAFGKTMPHKTHTELATCVTCHDLGAHKRVPLVKDIQARCAECHPK
ncbi:MAG: NapC/NirT family cytochrome c [Candidatus Riflebacteria bacterium]|nr:NapC/NirT family cytochrome c [Candidatus Riflebacteria bacterium]